MRNLTKYVASVLTIGFHPRMIRTAGRLHVALHRRFRGAGFLGEDTLILTTRGRRSGTPRSTPVYYVEEAGHLYIAASFAGSDTPPHWFRNLVADPTVGVGIGGLSRAHTARVLQPEESAHIWTELVAIYPTFGRYQARTHRRIPVIELTPIDGPGVVSAHASTPPGVEAGSALSGRTPGAAVTARWRRGCCGGRRSP